MPEEKGQMISIAIHDGTNGWKTERRESTCESRDVIHELWSVMNFGIHVAVICTSLNLNIENWRESFINRGARYLQDKEIIIGNSETYIGIIDAPSLGESLRDVKELLSRRGVIYDPSSSKVVEYYASADHLQHINKCECPHTVWNEWYASFFQLPKTDARVYILIKLPKKCFECFENKMNVLPRMIDWGMRVESSDEFFKRMFDLNECDEILDEFERIESMPESKEKQIRFWKLSDRYQYSLEVHPGRKSIIELNDRIQKMREHYKKREDIYITESKGMLIENEEHEKRER